MLVGAPACIQNPQLEPLAAAVVFMAKFAAEVAVPTLSKPNKVLVLVPV
jgi:hypothetical protein